MSFVNPFVSCLEEIVLRYTKNEAGRGIPQLTSQSLGGDLAIAGLLEFNTDKFKGKIYLCFNEEAYLGLYNSVVGEQHFEINEENEDWVAELLNIIYGQAKSILNRQGYELESKIPKVLIKEALNEQDYGGESVLVMPFDGANGKIRIEFIVNSIESNYNY